MRKSHTFCTVSLNYLRPHFKLKYRRCIFKTNKSKGHFKTDLMKERLILSLKNQYYNKMYA